MRFKSKNENYYSKNGAQGLFKNPYVVTTFGNVNPDLKRLNIGFELRYEVDGIPKTLDRPTIQITEFGIPTMITPEAGGDPIEILEYLNNGGTYNKDRIVDWSAPSFLSAQQYFELASIWTDLEFKDQPLKQLAIDWVLNVLKVEGVKLGEHFEPDFV